MIMISLFFHKGTAIWLKFNEILTFLYKRNLVLFPAEIGINSFSYPSRKKGSFKLTLTLIVGTLNFRMTEYKRYCILPV